MLVLFSLAEHVEDPNKLPILIFPEGTCINNTSVMQFKKGSFEVTDIVHPIVLKYGMLKSLNQLKIASNVLQTVDSATHFGIAASKATWPI
jgi:hypothetical protein